MLIQAREHQKPTKRILFLSDHDDVKTLVTALENEGYTVLRQYCSSFEVERLQSLHVDAFLIDLCHPSMENASICQEIRKNNNGPIIILSEPGNELIQLMALEMGADDFLFKPQPPALLLIKLRTLLRRTEKLTHASKTAIHLGELQIDAGRREVRCSGETVALTDREFDLLWCLAQNARHILSRDEIHKSLYKREYNGYDRSIDIYISRIRQKIGDDPHNPRYLKTIRGAGYLLVENQI